MTDLENVLAAADGALVVGVPRGHLTVDGAGHGGAGTSLGHIAARRAAVAGHGIDTAGTELDRATAADGASVPRRPVTDNAVSRAVVNVARPCLHKLAAVAVGKLWGDEGPGAFRNATAADLVTLGPSRPFGEFTIKVADVLATVLFLQKGGAARTTVLRVMLDSPVTE